MYCRNTSDEGKSVLVVDPGDYRISHTPSWFLVAHVQPTHSRKVSSLRSLSAWVCVTKRAKRGKGHDTTRAFVEAVTTAALPFHRETTMNRLEDCELDSESADSHSPVHWTILFSSIRNVRLQGSVLRFEPNLAPGLHRCLPRRLLKSIVALLSSFKFSTPKTNLHAPLRSSPLLS